MTPAPGDLVHITRHGAPKWSPRKTGAPWVVLEVLKSAHGTVLVCGDPYDDPADPAYNRPVRLPHPFSAETLQREDMLYDVVLVLGHNDAPPVPGAGSAIFFHLWNEAKPADQRTTEGCVAIARACSASISIRRLWSAGASAGTTASTETHSTPSSRRLCRWPGFRGW